jgi:acetylglutamate kinase
MTSPEPPAPRPAASGPPPASGDASEPGQLAPNAIVVPAPLPQPAPTPAHGVRNPRDIIVRLLRNLGGRKEVEQYLKQYSSVESQQFAVIKLGGGVLEDQIDTVATSLSFLEQVGLYPIVVHGAGPQLDRALAEAGIETRRVDGLRHTPAEALDLLRRVFQQQNLELVEALEATGCRARPIATGVFQATPLDLDRYGYVGEIVEVDDTAVAASIRAGQMPILTSLATSPSGQLLNVNADAAARALALKFQPFKIIMLTPSGGLRDGHKQIISAVNLSEDYEPLMAEPWVSGGMRLKLQQIAALLAELPDTCSVSITSPDQLARELFTHGGAGTLVRRGERVLCHQSFAQVDRDRLRALLETCFGRQLAAGYFENKSCHRVYLSEGYRATAILTLEQGLVYLDKFAVTRKAQGEGLGGSVWARMRRENPALFWRAQSSNEINPWYFQQSDGSYRTDKWTVFWYGLRDFGDIKRCVDIALGLPPTLRAHGTEEPERSAP